MLETLFGYQFKRIKEVVLNSRSKNSERTHAPRTIIGKDYPAYLLGRVGQLQFPAAIKRFDENDRHIEEKLHLFTYGGKVPSVAYGPFYRAWDNEMWKMLKDNSWKHILSTSGKSEQETGRLYFEAVEIVEKESRKLYGGDEFMDLCRDDFIWMMVIDGCFLLQVALSVLNGGSEQLYHLLDIPLVIPQGVGGCEQTTTMIRVAVSSMFIVGNQIPLVVLKALMGQTFFRNFINRGIWEEPSDLQRLVLFELLLMPMFQSGEVDAVVIPTDSLSFPFGRSRGKSTSFIKSFKPFSTRHEKKRSPFDNGATDLLHGLWLLMNGITDSKEENAESDNMCAYLVPKEDVRCAYDGVLPTVRSAKELKDIGITFQYTEGTGINEIRFQKNRLSSTLVLPRIVVFSEKEMYALFSSLIQYEVKHFEETKRKVCEYLQLMRGLVRSLDDAKVLATYGILVVDPTIEEKIAPIFQKLDIPHLRSYRSVIKSVRDELNHLTRVSRRSTFKKVSEVLSIVIILTVIQTVFAVLSYVQKK